MADAYLKFANSPIGQWLARTASLPQPLPLRRPRPGEREFVSPLALGVAAGSALSDLPRLLESAGIALIAPRGEPDSERVQGLLFDATGVSDTAGLDELYRFFHAHARRIEQHGRVVVLGRAPEDAASIGAAVAQRALEGLTRSLGKELRKAITVQLLYLRPGAEQALESSLRFFLSQRSAYVSGQVVRIAPACDQPAPFVWERPLAGRRALVTGASRGIGQAIAGLLAAQGADVTCLDVPQAESALRETAQSIGGRWLSLDICDAGAERALREAALAQGGLDIVVHNAGILRDKTIGRMSEAQWRDVLAVNLEAPLRLSEALLAEGLRNGGRIIGVSSISGIAGNLGQTNYATSKAGMIGLVQQLAPRAAARGITVNAVAPGFIETQMTASIPLMIREAGRRMNSLSQGGQPIDVAEAIGWLAHPASGGINGQVLRVCGQSLLGA